ncbi:MAG: FHA domain-containing protein [Nitrospirae bacterium]|nr:FHA domain-containing protein [Nitrospirota bacterium]
MKSQQSVKSYNSFTNDLILTAVPNNLINTKEAASSNSVFDSENDSNDLTIVYAAYAPCLLIDSGEHSLDIFPIEEGRILIGRSNTCNLIFSNNYISREHAALTFKENSMTIEDLKSTMGVIVNGSKIIKTSLKNGDEILLGSIKLTLIANFEAKTTKNTPSPSLKNMAGTIDLSLFKKGIEESNQLKHAESLRENDEFFDLFVLCETSSEIKSLDNIRNNLNDKLISEARISTKFNNKDAYWFYKDSISIGRTTEADHLLSNKAFSRIPIEIFMKKGEGFFIKINCSSDMQIKPIEIDNDFNKQQLVPNTSYPLGKSGFIIFSLCFPIEYRIYKDRFLIMDFLDPTDCIKKNYNFELNLVWKEFREETKRTLILGK